jgi:hypothetical protein
MTEQRLCLLVVLGTLVALQATPEGSDKRKEEKSFFHLHYGGMAVAMAVIIIYTKPFRDQVRGRVAEWWSKKSENEDEVPDITPDLRRKLLGKHVDPNGCGGTTSWGKWTQTGDEIEAIVTLPSGWQGTAKTIECKITSSGLLLMCTIGEARTTVIEGKLFKAVDPEGSSWQLERGSGTNGSTVVITLQKREQTKQNKHWPHVVVDDPLIDTQQFGTPITTIDSSRPDTIKQAVRSLYGKK